MRKWIDGTDGNRASIERWGSEEAARKSLETLENCSGCSDCYDCSGCSGCYDCYDCYSCYSCYGCYGCSRCSDCSRCYGCSGCYDCYRCYGCSGCSGLENSAPVVGLEPAEYPTVADIHKRVYEAASQPDALNMESWHTCETTHCRAGWVIHLAGQAGYELEKRTDPVFAAMRIYEASGFEINPCRFFDGDEEALADMKRLAEMEPANA